MSSTTLDPSVLSMIVCDQIITDRVTGKQSLIGMFSTIHAARFPATQPQLCVHVSMTDGRGKTPVSIRIVDADDARAPIVRGEGVVNFKSPRDIANLALQFYGLSFPEPGEYRAQLFCREALLREARLILIRAQRRPRRPPQPPGEPGSDEA